MVYELLHKFVRELHEFLQIGPRISRIDTNYNLYLIQGYNKHYQ